MKTFAIRFGSPELAAEFKAAFVAGQEEMTKVLAGADATEGKAEADEASKAIESLSVKEKESTEEKPPASTA